MVPFSTRALRAILEWLGLCVALAARPHRRPASIGLGVVVSANPANVTPNVASGAVYKVLRVGGTMYAGGAFGSVSTPAGVSPGGTFARSNIVAFNANLVNPAGTRLVAVGNFTVVGGQTRYRAFMPTLGATASVNAWHYPPLQNLCGPAACPTTCATSTSRPTGRAQPDPADLDQLHRRRHPPLGGRHRRGRVRPGHQRWLDNPQGADTAGPGAVSRPGIGGETRRRIALLPVP